MESLKTMTKNNAREGVRGGQSMLLSGTLRSKSLVKSLRKVVIMLCSKLEIDHGIMLWGEKQGITVWMTGPQT